MSAPLEDRELRLAVVMTGGVSLAIWMGGVALELDRLLRSGDEVYAGLCALARYRPRVDVVSGTSAGGLNGALLAAAVARGVPLQGLREVWQRTAAFELLLRDADTSDPRSLMKGDEYFGEHLKETFAHQFEAEPHPPRHGVDLFVTTTLLRGEDSRLVDSFGTLIPDTDHHGLFHFHRDEMQPPEAAGQLALAARSSASFPVAFEPSWVPKAVMGTLASFRSDHYLVDGGVLVNRPLGPALDAVYAKSAAREEVERVLLYVVPDPGRVEPGIDQREPGYTITEAGLDSLIAIPRNESVKRELTELRDHNRDVDRQRGARELILRTWFAGPDPCPFPEPDPVPALDAALRRRLADALLQDLLRRWPDDVELRFRPDRYLEVLDDIRGQVGAAQLPDVVEQSATIALGFARYAFAFTQGDARERLGEVRRRLHEVLRELRLGHDARVAAIQPPEGDFIAWAPAQARRYLAHELDLERLQDTIAEQTAIAAGIVRGIERFVPYAEGLAPEGADVRDRLRRLQAIEHALGVERPRIEQTVRLLQVSAVTRDAFGVAEDSSKLAGMQLAHFGAFYKPSWRANDWLWGRLDAAGWLAQLLLDPERLRGIPDLADRIEALAAGGRHRDWLDARLDRAAIAQELSGIDTAAALPECSLAVARRIQLEILDEDLEYVAAAVEADRRLGAMSPKGEAFLRAWGAPPGPDRLVAALKACKLGEEKLDAGAPLALRDAAQAASVGTAALSGKHSGLPRFLRDSFAFRVLHAAALWFYRFLPSR